MYINTYRLRNGTYPPTAVALAERLGWEIICTSDLSFTNDPVINWGKNVQAAHHALNINAPIDKATAFEKLHEAGVSVPKFLTGNIVRRRLRHQQGRDIVRYNTDGNKYFFVEEIDKVEEYRVEVFNYGQGHKAFRGHIKRPNGDGRDFNWNRANTNWESYGYRGIREALGTDIIDISKEAVRALGYDFGAVDVIRGRDNKIYVLEVNSAPHLGEEGLAKYAWRINKWAENLQN